MKQVKLCVPLLLFVFSTFCKGQNKVNLPTSNTEISINSPEFSSVTRNLIQDRRGNIWIATFGGVFRYDGKSFTNITSKVSSARFFSVLEDRNGHLWFGSVGSGVYRYDGASFRNFTTKDGLVNDEIVCLYEDKRGTIWLGANGGLSRYDGKSFQNYKMNGNAIIEDRTGIPFPNFTRPPHEINTIIEDKTGKFWLGTRDNTFIYDGKVFTSFTHSGQSFTNIRTIIEDRKGNIWLGGQGGLWRYDGLSLTHITQHFVGYLHEDKNGNIWTSSESAHGHNWVISRYEEASLTHKIPTVTTINPALGMLFGILAANDGSIWFGAGGVYRYDGKAITDFKK